MPLHKSLSLSTSSIILGLLLYFPPAAGAATETDSAGRCDDYREDHSNVYWGDLHVHTAYSLDAYAFGNRHDPADAYAFAKGQQLTLADGKTLTQLERPLDFMAVTDHAETFDVMYLCSDPQYLDNEYCRGMRQGSVKDSSLTVFREYLLPLIAGASPKPSPLCDTVGVDCPGAARRQWRRTQEQANAANRPCDFTAFIGNEWSATPNDQHWHRNLIFAGDSVTEDAVDYIRHPSVERLWRALDEQCRPEQGCDVIAIPHNTNLAEGGSFDVETADDLQLRRRAKYERLIEIHQSKGSSECLSPYWDDIGPDCDFEILLPHRIAEQHEKTPLTREHWQALRSSYARSVLKRGLLAYSRQTDGPVNPLQLGFIGSTDGHAGTPGAVAEDNWKGDAWGWDNKVRNRFQRIDYNPGGLVAVWAEENTRASIFSALHRREVYGTSGTRITMKFSAYRQLQGDICQTATPPPADARMGGQLPAGGSDSPHFVIQANMDRTPLARVDVVKGWINRGEVVEQVTTVYESAAGKAELCLTWQDPAFEADAPAFWYVRVLEQPTPRWSKLDCSKAGICDEFPAADRMIQERAWASPIWHLP